jgi:hypothetical protein
MVHEFHGLEKTCELENALDGVAARPPAGKLLQGRLNLGIG